MRLSSLLVASLLSAVAAVLELTPDNFDQFVGGSKPALVKFFAPWCGHCKAMAADYDTFGDVFKNADVVVAKVDADAHKELASRFGVKGFPTLKWFPAGSSEAEDYSGGRTVDDLVSFTNNKIGTKYRVAKPASAVLDLDPSNFDSIVADPTKHKLVEFFAPWCGHCKSLAPTYEKVAAAFAGESDVVVAKVDADKHRSLGERFGVSGFPTIKYFPATESSLDDVTPYEGARDGDAFVKFLNEKAGTQRTLAGGLLPTAGRVEALDALAQKFVAASDKNAVIAETKNAISELSGKEKQYGELYLRAMQKAAEKGDSYFAKEIARLDGVLGTSSVGAAKRTDFLYKKNVLSAFTE